MAKYPDTLCFMFSTLWPLACGHLDCHHNVGFRGPLETPSRRVELVTAEADGILAMQVDGVKSTIVIWINEAVEPDEIFIGFEG